MPDTLFFPSFRFWIVVFYLQRTYKVEEDMQKKFFSFLILAACIAVTSCANDKKKGNAVKASLALENISGLSLVEKPCPDLGDGEVAECWTPSIYGVKLLSVIVSPDQAGAQSAAAGLIWANPDCAVSTIMSEINEKEFPYDSASDCADDQVETFFELARTSEEVNEELNSQYYNILPGTYNYVQLGFCVDGAKSKNGRFQAEGMSEPYEFTWGGCGMSSVRADPPIVVSEGQSITVSLTYDLTNTAYISHADSNPEYCYISEDELIVRCIAGPNNLTPSLVQD